jgi:hypothetical protein
VKDEFTGLHAEGFVNVRFTVLVILMLCVVSPVDHTFPCAMLEVAITVSPIQKDGAAGEVDIDKLVPVTGWQLLFRVFIQAVFCGLFPTPGVSPVRVESEVQLA